MSDIRDLRTLLDNMACLSGMSYKSIGMLYEITEHLDFIDVEGGFARLRELASAEREELIYILPDCKTCANKDDNRTCALCVGKAIDYQSSFYEPLAATEPKGEATT